MTEYIWWDAEEWDESDGLDFDANTLEDAKRKAAWMFMREVGEQHEYDLPIALKNKETGETVEFEVHIEMVPEFFFK